MNGPGRVPLRIQHPRLLLGEGKDEVAFFEALLKHLGIDGVQVEDYQGKGKLRDYLGTLPLRPDYRLVDAVAITRDADDEPEAAWRAVVDAMSAKLGCITPGPGTFSAGRPRVGALVLPGPNLPGSLEDVCLDSIGQHPARDCVEEFLACASRQGLAPAEGQRGKARLQAWLAVQPRPGRRLGEAARDGLWNFDSPALTELRQFLADLAR